MRLYYAHPMYLYNTPQETRDLETLRNLGFDVLNPNDRLIQIAFESWRGENESKFNSTFGVMNFFTDLLIIDGWMGRSPYGKIDGLAFRATPDGSVPGGVAKEIAAARGYMPIIELPSFATRLMMDHSTTREYLKEVGQR